MKSLGYENFCHTLLSRKQKTSKALKPYWFSPLTHPHTKYKLVRGRHNNLLFVLM